MIYSIDRESNVIHDITLVDKLLCKIALIIISCKRKEEKYAVCRIYTSDGLQNKIKNKSKSLSRFSSISFLLSFFREPNKFFNNTIEYYINQSGLHGGITQFETIIIKTKIFIRLLFNQNHNSSEMQFMVKTLKKIARHKNRRTKGYFLFIQCTRIYSMCANIRRVKSVVPFLDRFLTIKRSKASVSGLKQVTR